MFESQLPSFEYNFRNRLYIALESKILLRIVEITYKNELKIIRKIEVSEVSSWPKLDPKVGLYMGQYCVEIDSQTNKPHIGIISNLFFLAPQDKKKQ